MSPRIFFSVFLLAMSLSSPLVAGPLDRWKEKKREGSFSSQEQEEQGRQISECVDWDDLRQEAGATMITASDLTMVSPEKNDWQIFSSSDQPSAFLLARKQTFIELATAFRKAYERGDEHHPDWDKVNELIEKVCPVQTKEDEETYTNDILSPGKKGDQAKVKTLQYFFLRETLPAIKKTSVVAGLRALNGFQTADLIRKTNEEQTAWEEAKSAFEKVCKEHALHSGDQDDLPATNLADDDFDAPGPFDNYLQHFAYQLERIKIENQINGLHHDIMQNILKANTTTDDFEKRTFSKDFIICQYQQFLASIVRKKEAADPALRQKWEQFNLEVAARALHDLTQVERIKLWKNRNQINAIHKKAEQVEIQTKTVAPGVGKEISLSIKNQKTQVKAALTALEERKENLNLLKKNVEAQKSKENQLIGITRISSLVEKEIEEALEEAEQKMDHWKSIIRRIESMEENNLSIAFTPIEQQPHQSNSWFSRLRNCLEASSNK